MSPYSGSYFNLLTYAKQKQPPGDDKNCGDFLPPSSEEQRTISEHDEKTYIVLFAYSSTCTHTDTNFLNTGAKC